MPNTYLDSDKIIVYPNSERSTNPVSRLSSEYAMTNIIRLLTGGVHGETYGLGNGSFIITNPNVVTQSPSDAVIEFCIYGYYFRCKYADLIALNLKPLYAGIIINSQTSGTYSGMIELVGQDTSVSSTLKYNGLHFSSSSTFDPTVNSYIQLLDSDGTLTKSNYIWNKFSNAYMPYFTDTGTTSAQSPTEEDYVPSTYNTSVYQKKIWIDTTQVPATQSTSAYQKYIPKIYVTNKWIPLGAVYK